VVVPREIEREVLQRAKEKVQKENLSRTELLAGKTLHEVYEKYSVL
jgi:4-hydroxy-4-methyl-2-oxoglutarate aldolase